jgi:predicted nucleic acid-binding protein
MIVLDTNILSELMRPAPEAAVEQWLADQPEASVFISAITDAMVTRVFESGPISEGP